MHHLQDVEPSIPWLNFKDPPVRSSSMGDRNATSSFQSFSF